MSDVIHESGMTFGPYAEDCFHIEKSTAYEQIVTKGVKTAEFILFKRNIFWVVEAKSSAPRQRETYFTEICDKLLQSCLLTVMVCIGRQPSNGALFDGVALASPFSLVLVIKNAPDQHLPPLNDELNQYLRKAPLFHILGGEVSSKVLNENGARRCGLILDVNGS